MLIVKYGAYVYYRQLVEQVKIDLQENFDKSEYKHLHNKLNSEKIIFVLNKNNAFFSHTSQNCE